MDKTFLQARITKTKELIVIYEDAIDALVSGGVQEYTLDTGQTVQRVKKLDVEFLNKQLDSLYNRCATMEARLNGSGTITVRPAW